MSSGYYSVAEELFLGAPVEVSMTSCDAAGCDESATLLCPICAMCEVCASQFHDEDADLFVVPLDELNFHAIVLVSYPDAPAPRAGSRP